MDLRAGIIDYGSGNFSSVYNTVSSLTKDIKTIRTPADFDSCSHIILPGVGAFAAAYSKLLEINLFEALNEHVFIKKKPILGICVGFQLMAENGFEFGSTPGFGWLKGDVLKFNFKEQAKLNLPHIGWNDIEDYKEMRLFKNINPGDPSFYFVHSFHFSPRANYNCAFSTYGYRFIAAVENENIFGVQFHPEKSLSNGVRLLKNFFSIND